MPLLPVFAALALALQDPSAPDTTVFPPRETIIRLYTDCTEARWPWGMADSLVPKTPEELLAGVARRRLLEERWRTVFRERAGDSIAPTPLEQWVYPLRVRGRLRDNFRNPRPGGPHGALDIFVEREGVTVRSPVSGVVVAAGDDWVGRWVRRQGLAYESGGLSRRAGNGVLIFDPASGGYHYLIHLQAGVLVRAGDVVRAGQTIGRVGHSGNAAQPGHGKHLHLAFKRPGIGCDVDGVLVAENPYPQLLEARRRMEAGR